MQQQSRPYAPQGVPVQYSLTGTHPAPRIPNGPQNMRAQNGLRNTLTLQPQTLYQSPAMTGVPAPHYPRGATAQQHLQYSRLIPPNQIYFAQGFSYVQSRDQLGRIQFLQPMGFISNTQTPNTYYVSNTQPQALFQDQHQNQQNVAQPEATEVRPNAVPVQQTTQPQAQTELQVQPASPAQITNMTEGAPSVTVERKREKKILRIVDPNTGAVVIGVGDTEAAGSNINNLLGVSNGYVRPREKKLSSLDTRYRDIAIATNMLDEVQFEDMKLSKIAFSKPFPNLFTMNSENDLEIMDIIRQNLYYICRTLLFPFDLLDQFVEHGVLTDEDRTYIEFLDGEVIQIVAMFVRVVSKNEDCLAKVLDILRATGNDKIADFMDDNLVEIVTCAANGSLGGSFGSNDKNVEFMTGPPQELIDKTPLALGASIGALKRKLKLVDPTYRDITTAVSMLNGLHFGDIKLSKTAFNKPFPSILVAKNTENELEPIEIIRQNLYYICRVVKFPFELLDTFVKYGILLEADRADFEFMGSELIQIVAMFVRIVTTKGQELLAKVLGILRSTGNDHIAELLETNLLDNTNDSPSKGTPSRRFSEPWSCPRCTFVNRGSNTACEGCADGIFLVCPRCTLENKFGYTVCEACGYQLGDK